MRRLILSSLAFGLMASPVLAGATSNITPIPGTLGGSFADGKSQGLIFQADQPQGPPGPPRNLYDNIPTALGGTSDPGTFGVFPNTHQGMYSFRRWGTGGGDPYDPQWGDDIHELSVGGGGPANITNIWYAYALSGVSAGSHVIKIYDMFPASGTHGQENFQPINKGPLLSSIVVQSLPGSGAFINTVQLSQPLQLPHSSIWIKFEDLEPGVHDTFWYTGGNPGVGASNKGITYTVKGTYNVTFGGNPYVIGPSNSFIGGTAFTYLTGMGTAETYYYQMNMVLGLNGFHVPAPAVISLLGLGGLVTLRRRRVRAA